MPSYWWSEDHGDQSLLRVAIFQGSSSKDGKVIINVAQVEFQAKRAREEHGAHLLVFPELFLSGYGLTRDLMLSAARHIAEEQVLSHIQSIARRHSIALLICYPELVKEKIYNSATLIDEHGDILLTYRKTHLWAEKERALFVEGEELSPIVEIRGVRVAVLICYDIEMSEVARCLAVRGAQLLLNATALGPSPENVNLVRFLVSARALENHVWIAYANLAPPDFLGLSRILGPDGEVLSSVENDPLIVADLIPKNYLSSIQSTPYLADRRPALYTPLTDPQYLAQLPAEYKYTNN